MTIAEHQGASPDDEIIYELDYNLSVRSVEPTVDFQRTHAEMEKAGQLDHKLSADDIRNIMRSVSVRRNTTEAAH
jgi:hypothetical protein